MGRGGGLSKLRSVLYLEIELGGEGLGALGEMCVTKYIFVCHEHTGFSEINTFFFFRARFVGKL